MSLAATLCGRSHSPRTACRTCDAMGDQMAGGGYVGLVESLACSICERFDRPVAHIRGAEVCGACVEIWTAALRSGQVIRWRCARVLADAPETCGRVYDVRHQEHRSGPIVVDTSGACPTCRPAQRAYVERTVGRVEWEPDHAA